MYLGIMCMATIVVKRTIMRFLEFNQVQFTSLLAVTSILNLDVDEDVRCLDNIEWYGMSGPECRRGGEHKVASEKN